MYIDDFHRHAQVTTTLPQQSPAVPPKAKEVGQQASGNDCTDNTTAGDRIQRQSQEANNNDTIFFNNFIPTGKLERSDLNQSLLKVQYAIRGTIPTLAERYQCKLKQDPKSLPFNSVVFANIGNPQELKQKPLTFTRQVLSLLEYPQLLQRAECLVQSGCFNKDAVERATSLLDSIKSMGSYSPVQGFCSIRKSVAEYLERRDGETASYNDIFLTNGATAGITYLLNVLCKDSNTGVLLPVPEYPLYTALAVTHGATLMPYYLKEESNWSIDTEEIERVLVREISKGVKPTVMVVINPGNPTGAVLSTGTIARILRLSAKYGFAVLADEVYQENVFSEFATFHSFKKVLRSLQRRFPGTYDCVQLCSVHSTSKGVTGECGHRGGYMELVGFSDEVKHEILKASSLDVCSSTSGQVIVDLMVNPPKLGDESFEMDQLERRAIHDSLQQRCAKLYEMLNSLEGLECQKPQGSMYLFPKLLLPKRALEEAARERLSPDEFYCLSLLKHTGICTVPGTGFGQCEGTYHLRTTFLAPGTEWIDRWRNFHRKFYEEYRD